METAVGADAADAVEGAELQASPAIQHRRTPHKPVPKHRPIPKTYPLPSPKRTTSLTAQQRHATRRLTARKPPLAAKAPAIVGDATKVEVANAVMASALTHHGVIRNSDQNSAPLAVPPPRPTSTAWIAGIQAAPALSPTPTPTRTQDLMPSR